ncbi:MAG: hypothetical protein Hyperionvirus10_45 [Hyperionvirus sp.]|uniref:Uncharacterized protein n=1 Tax=Hyperionvirus sp. TaxID=2487770 RepID=A0A3G5AEB4_9VIRU|nr:MAG: hypothetical protein Hyperionvirus10_45 [Hyperionvirus sp.]
MGNNLGPAFQACSDRYNAKEYDEALKQFKVLGEQSHGESIYMMGVMYYNGEGCDKNLEEAYKQFLKAHSLSEIKGTFRVGMCLLKGEGVSKDEKEAVKYLQEARSKSYTAASFELGVLFRMGTSQIEKNILEAVKCLKEAQGHVEATYLLGIITFFGELEKDYKKAKVYFEEAHSKGHTEATYQLGFIHQNGFGTETDCKSAFQFYEESYKKGFTRSAYHLGQILLESKDPNDHILGVKYLTEARVSGDTDAMELLGNFYLDGSVSVPEDGKEALKCFLEAYTKGSLHLAFEIGEQYATGVKKDITQAKQFYEQALVENNNLAAAKGLFQLYLSEKDEKNIPIMQKYLALMENSNDPGLLYYAGTMHFWGFMSSRSFPVHQKKGFQCYIKSAELGYSDAMSQLWDMYFVGRMCDRDYQKAFDWYSKAYCPKGNRDNYYINLAGCFSGVPLLTEKLYLLYIEEYRSQKISEDTLSKLLLTIPIQFFIEKTLSEVKVLKFV